jgi:hypothetical protein
MRRRGSIFGSQRAGRHDSFGVSMIDFGKLGAVGLGLPHMLNLGRQRSYPRFVQDSYFGGRWPDV